MSYKSKHGITKIKKGKRYNLDVSLDYDIDENKKYPVLLFTPNFEDKNEHFHIDLSRKEAKILSEWLNEYLDDRRYISKK
jgi:hypothetical protein